MTASARTAELRVRQRLRQPRGPTTTTTTTAAAATTTTTTTTTPSAAAPLSNVVAADRENLQLAIQMGYLCDVQKNDNR